ncbi:ABC-type transport system involved in cytochrome c biogenesis ATPase subunit [Rhizobium leguminosarum]|uniref:ABC-type transport system involved in cytochrome c biogenesis ATPase subunit n=1 Tax=Rhizobium leguminosarum TaxID=384 RepID=A0A7Z0E0Q0_RHILE|nr:AAA family ATPase [Rhizobium leguminosarum]NYJ12505.1 ABC-type transport system involved in cytochrome c biogenesis ATPase subunit [Rhizobium leguminosarum]
MVEGANFSEFQIKGLRGGKTVSARLMDNTLILVGENGSGKTTFLRMLFYFLSGRWSNLAEFDFETIVAKVNNRNFMVSHDDVISMTSLLVDQRMLNRLPPVQRRRVNELVDQGRFSDAEALATAYGSHLGIVTPPRQTELFKDRDRKVEAILALQEEVANTLQAQILYLPTYRRIERELSSIIQGYDPDDRRGPPIARQQEDARDYVELVEFGMNDVKKSINRTLEEIRDFQLLGATRLSLSYLGDVVSQSYKSVDRHEIENSSDESIDSILNRIDNTILSDQHKRQLREVVRSAKTTSNVPSEHEQIIYHYFSKLIRFQRELQIRERSISNFCDLCSTYIVDKIFTYSTREFTFKITSKREGVDVPLSELSSGEKQIVSLFSHLYLSGRQKYFVLIDEPELSLSVPWQRRFLVDIHQASFCAGLVAVTHSPFIYDNDLRKHAHALGEFVSGADWGNIE